MTRALVIEPAGNLWGSERALLDLLDGLQAVEAVVCCPPDRPLQPELAKRGIRVLPYFVYGLHHKSRLQRLRAAMGVVRAGLECRPDVIYINQCGAYRVSLPAARLLGLPIVAHVRLFEDAAYIARQRPNPSRVRGLIAISGAVEHALREFGELDSIQVHRRYDGYAPAQKRLCSQPRRANRIACVGRLTPVKGQEILIRAISPLMRNYGAVECLIIGDGEPIYVDFLKQLADDEGVGASLRWPGFVLDVMSSLSTSSVLVCPSEREPLGRVVFEAWDAGAVPVAFAGSGGAAELISEAKGGILYHEQSPAALAGALQTALELDPQQRECLIENGRSWVAEWCDLRMYGKAVSQILSSTNNNQKGLC
ncbi:MAG: glycosyltransferase family 4 protein [Stellaceae bacterium]